MPAWAEPFRLPSIIEPASPEHHKGKVVLVELVTPDIAAAKSFYGGLFGWTFRDFQPAAVVVVVTRAAGVGGAETCRVGKRYLFDWHLDSTSPWTFTGVDRAP